MGDEISQELDEEMNTSPAEHMNARDGEANGVEQDSDEDEDEDDEDDGKRQEFQLKTIDLPKDITSFKVRPVHSVC
jgi:hypothetical protein